MTIIIYLTYLLHYTWVKWNGFLAHTTFLICSQIRLTALSISLRRAHLREWKLVFCLVLWRVYVKRIYSSIAKDLKFDWSIQVTLKRKSVFAGTATRKLTNTPVVIFSFPWRGTWFIFMKQIIIVLFWVIIYSYLQKFLKIGVLKNFTIHRKTLASEFLFNQPVAWYFFNKRIRHRCILVNFAKLSKTPFLQTLGLLLLYLLNISVT